MDIKNLLNGSTNSISIEEEFTIPSDFYNDTDIKELSKVKVKGEITYPSDDNLFLDVECSATMKLTDSVNLELVDYPFSFKISENVYEKLENNQFSLDIISILWENIVLEVPIRFSKVKDYKDLVGDGWKVISEDDVLNTTNNPFKELLNNIEKE